MIWCDGDDKKWSEDHKVDGTNNNHDDDDDDNNSTVQHDRIIISIIYYEHKWKSKK